VQHLGNIQTAIVAWLQVRLAGGQFALRMDDIDTPRVKEGSAAQILDDLRWLGLDWDLIEGIDFVPDNDGVYVESHYLSYYREAFEVLEKKGLLYPCACSRKQIRKVVGKPNAAGHYVYPGTCRGRKISYFAEEQQLVWRYRAPDELICFKDELMGEQTQNVARAWGDLIVKRFNDLYAYQLVSVVDDIKMGITDVVRGEDLLDSTPGQIALFEALGAEPPRFWHVPLKTDGEGNKLAKRDGSDSLQMLREAGKTPQEVVGQLAFELGLVETDAPLGLRALLRSVGS
jgi:glutamyl-tRNA synthetase